MVPPARRLKWYCLVLSALVTFATILSYVAPLSYPARYGWHYKIRDGWVEHTNDGISVAVFPVWATTFVLAAVTVVVWRRDVRRVPVGLCVCCGYDLTGNVSGRCPECGTAVAKALERRERA
jgi:hypothetical protein